MNKQILMHPHSTLNILLDIKRIVETTIDYNYKGICDLYSIYHEYPLRDCLTQAGVFWHEWPEYSGDVFYPIPAQREFYNPTREYHDTTNMWDQENPYGRARMRLLDWLIKQLTTVIGNMENTVCTK